MNVDFSSSNKVGFVRKRGFLPLVSEVFQHGGPGFVQFAITNVCNARCGFCGFAVDQLDPKIRHSVTLAEAAEAIDILARNHIGYLLFVGGEPLAHKDIGEMVRLTSARGMHPMICTNGALWTRENMRSLARDGLKSVIMSVDAHDVTEHENHRGLPGVCEKLRMANATFKELGVQTTASVTASRLVRQFGKLPAFLKGLGFESLTFSYPLTHLDSSYLSHSQSSVVRYSIDELVDLFEQMKALRCQGEVVVVNPAESLTEMQRHLRGEKELFPCLGGHRYFYLDWHLQLYRCHQWAKPMCHIRDWNETRIIRDDCTRCMIDCYRDASVLQFVAVNASDAWHNLRQGRLLKAAENVFDKRNLTSLKAVWKDRSWIRDV